MNIAILGKDFINWGGGRELLYLIIEALIHKKENSIKLFLLIPQEAELQKTKRLLKNFIKLIFNILNLGRKYSYASIPTKQTILDSFEDHIDEIKIVYYKDTNENLISCLKKINAHILLPCLQPLDKSFPIPWVGYIADFQHRYYPEFFSQQECKYRNNLYKKMIINAKQIIVNGYEIKKDINKFYLNNKCNIFNLPFSPIPDKNWLEKGQKNIQSKYNLPGKYFIISNQFWKHKSHITAFEALSKLEKNSRINDIHIICTGNTQDYRCPEYFEELKKTITQLNLDKRIHFLGHIPKIDQINIMKSSIAVIQPTLFEGGPGGFSVYNAISIGIPTIVSDISINLEITNENNVIFFKAGSSEDLALKMNKLLNKNIKRPCSDSLIENAQKRKKNLANKLLEIIDYSIKKENKNESFNNNSMQKCTGFN